MSATADLTTAERRPEVVRTSGDPTASPPEFGVSRSWESNPTLWVAGSWLGTYDTINKTVNALTPIMGQGQALDITETGIWVIYVRWTVADETPVRAVEQVTFY